MPVDPTDDFEIEMLELLGFCACARGLNGPASYLLAMELNRLDKPIETITLGELRDTYELVVKKYNRW